MKDTNPVRNTTHARDVFKKLNILAYSLTAGPLGEIGTQCRGGQPAFKGLRIFYYPSKIREGVNYDVTAITERDGSGYRKSHLCNSYYWQRVVDGSSP